VYKLTANVIIVDWKRGASGNPFINKDIYVDAAQNTKIVGQEIAKFMKFNNILPQRVTCLGHSLGGHVKKSIIYYIIFVYY
jgi:hypothetical protein